MVISACYRTLAARVCCWLLCLALMSAVGCSKRIDDLEQRTDAAIAELRNIQAEHTAALSEVRSDVRTLSGKVEEIQYVSVGKTRELEKSLLRLGTRVPPPPGVPEDLLSQDEEAIARLSGAGAEGYRQALAQLRSGDLEEARKAFSRFVEQNPGTAFTDNALFWLGICFTKLGQYDRAVVAFSDVYQKYPAEDMVPAALFYLSEALVKAGSVKDAELSLQKLIDEHAKSSFAAKARMRLAELRKGKAPARRR
jgi:tol-pal system protein YbgF